MCIRDSLYELRQISLSGYMPDLVACRECGQYERPLFHFYPVSGELVCAGCDTAPKAGQYVELSPSVLAAMRHILSSDAGKLYSFTLSQQALLQLTAVCERYGKTQPVSYTHLAAAAQDERGERGHRGVHPVCELHQLAGRGNEHCLSDC